MYSDISFEILDDFLKRKKGKIIHQIWFGTIPNKKEAKKAYEKLKIYRNSWTEKNPNWFRMEWNKTLCINFIRLYFPEHIEMFTNYKYEIQRCDAVRYLILYRYGGWYADMDYYCNRPLEEAMVKFKHDIYFVQTPNSTFLHDSDHISNSLMYSIPEHPYWKQVMVELQKNQDTIYYYYSRHLAVMFTTGPAILNRIYQKFRRTYKVKSLPYKLFHPFGIKDEILSLKNHPKVFTIHVSKSSWSERDTVFLNTIFRDGWFILFVVLMFLLVIVFGKCFGG